MKVFYVALGSSISLVLLVWVGGSLSKQVLDCIGKEPSLQPCTCFY